MSGQLMFSRDELIAICRDAVVPQNRWSLDGGEA